MEEARSHQNVETVEEVKNSVAVESNGTVPSSEEGSRDAVRLSRRRGGMSLYWIAVVGLLIVTLALLGVVVMRRLSRGGACGEAALASGSVSSSPSVVPAAASSVGPAAASSVGPAAASSVSSVSSAGVAVKAGAEDVLPEHEEEEEEEEEEVVSRSVASKESEVVEERLEIAGLKVGEDGFSVPYVRGLKSDLLVTEDDEGILVALPHGLSMRFRPVAAGSFVMGSDNDDDGRSLQEDERDVTLTESYWLGEHEVTRGAWKAVMGCVSSSRDESDDCPMVFVNRNDAQAFCGALNDLYGESLPEGYVFGLPTVAQWEYAAGGGVEREDEAFSGSDILSEVAWHSGNSGGRLHRVGGKRPNQLGLYDMSGNAMEYCRDDISDELSELDPFGTVGRGWYGLRGGSYDCREAGCRVSSFALRYGRGGRFGVGGFRVGIVPAEEYGADDDDDDDESDEDESEDEDESDDAASGGEKGEKSDKKGESEKSDKKGESEKSDKKEERAKSGKSDKEDDSEKASKEDKKEDEKGKDGKKKRSRRSSAQLLRSRDSLDHSKARTIDLKRRKLLQTREQFSRRGEEDEEEKSEDGKGKDGKKKRSRRSSAQLLRSRDSLDHSKARTIDLKRRKLLQTREQQEAERKAERKARREAKAKELAERKAKEKAAAEAAAKAAKEKSKKPGAESSRPSLFDVAKEEAVVSLGERSGLKLELVRVKGGKMVLGSPAGEVGRGGDEAQREVTLEDTYWLGKFEVSQEEFFEMMDFNPSLIRDEQLPVENVSWQDAKAFCEALNEHFEGRLPEGYVFDLPTEEEWEYASRCGELQEESEGIYSGIDDLEDIVWMGTSSGTTLPCEDLQANALGIYGMGGNVQEWCSTVCERDEYGEVRVVEGGSEGRYRAVRGGAWCFGSRKSRSAYRTSSLPTFRSNYVGFRVALVKRAVAPVKKALED